MSRECHESLLLTIDYCRRTITEASGMDMSQLLVDIAKSAYRAPMKDNGCVPTPLAPGILFY